MTTDERHAFDEAIRLLPGPDENVFQGRITPAYGNMVGPYGGIIAAALLNAVLCHPDHTGQPVSLTVNYAAPLVDAEFEIHVKLIRNNRSTQHWNLELAQEGKIAVTASCVFAKRHETWDDTETEMPEVPAADQTPSLPAQGMPAWVSNYDIRLLDGMVTLQPEHRAGNSISSQWVSDQPPRSLDFPSLCAICDSFFPRIFVRRQEIIPAGTVSLTIHFHANHESLTRQGDRPVLARARANRFHNGYFDQNAWFWSEAGELLASSHQMVYFKA